MTAMLTAPDEATAQEQLQRDGLTDGLPVIVPTPERVERMVLASGYEPDALLGVVPPLDGRCAIQDVAIQAVMAGCLPDHMPVVVAAVRAVLEPEFDLREMQATTHNLAPLIIVNGPARWACGDVASGYGALGPGHRANATIGRALRLVLLNLGGAMPGVGDMALLGHPGKFTYCLAEAEEQSPFPPLAESRGIAEGGSAVTVIGCEAPHSVTAVVDDDAESASRLIAILAATVANLGSNGAYLRGGAIPPTPAVAVIVLNPDHARCLANAGHSRESIMAAVAERAANPRRVVRALNPASVVEGDGEELIPALADAGRVLVVVAGGPGAYSAVMPYWGGGAHGAQPVTMPIVLEQACEVPLPR